MIVLDTHILVWWVSRSGQLSSKARAAIEKEQKNQGKIIVSSISAWEIAMLESRGRLKLSMDVDSWLQITRQIENVHFVPLDNKVLIESIRLPGKFHKDPADRMIVAQSRAIPAPLITADEKILSYQHVKTIW